MERLGDTLKRLGLDSISDDSDPPAADPAPSCPRCRDAGWLRADVSVDHSDFGRLYVCECRKEAFHEARRHRLEQYSNLGPLSRLTFETLLPEGIGGDPRGLFRQALSAAERFAHEPAGWLVLLGPPGCGKTHLAAAIANARIEQGHPAFFAVVPDLLDHLRSTFHRDTEVQYDELFETVREAPLLVLDDLGTHSSTPWAEEKLFQIVNHRTNVQLPTVVTSNLKVEHFGERMRVRLFSDPARCEICVVRDWENSALQRLSRAALHDLREAGFDNFDDRGASLDPRHWTILRHAKTLARQFAEHPDGWLVLQGRPGTGKTHLAAAIANACSRRGHEALFVTAPELLDHLRATYAPDSKVTYDEVFEAVRSTSMLIIDDLGAHSNTPWAEEKLYQLLNYRYNARLPTVITTNFAEGFDQVGRLDYRINDPAVSTVYEIDVPSYRASTHYRAPARGRGRPRRT